MARYSQKKVEEILRTADIVDVISEFVSLQQAGKNLKGLCPFHNEKTPSFFVSKERQLFNCFGCGEKGNVIGFIQKYKHLNYGEALTFLGEKYNIQPDTQDTFKKQDNKEKYYRINELAKQFFSLQLLNLETGKSGLEYLKSRGFDEEILSHFEIGLAPKSGNLLYETLSKDFHDYELIEVGLIGKNESDCYDIFRNKIMFPIKDDLGKTVGFSGRIFNNEENTAKYVNSTQTEIFSKSEILFNLDKAIPFINQNKRIVLMEGFFDVMSAYTADIKEAVCSMGTALTINHAKLIKKYTDNVVVCYDGDDAGLRAAYKALVLLGQVGLDVKVALLPNKMDPDDFIKKKSKEAFRNILKNKLYDQYDFVYEMIVKDHDLAKPAEIEKAKNALFEYLNKVASSTIREIYLKKFSNDTNVNYEDILSDYHNFQVTAARMINIKQRQNAIIKAQENKRLANKDVELAAKTLIHYFAVHKESREYIYSSISSLKIDNVRLKELLLTSISLYNQKIEINELQLKRDLSNITEEELKMFKSKENEVFSEKELKDCIETLIKNKFEADIIECMRKVNEVETNEEKDLYTKRIMELNTYIQNIKGNRNVKKTSN